jgi:hypothetical protein
VILVIVYFDFLLLLVIAITLTVGDLLIGEGIL